MRLVRQLANWGAAAAAALTFAIPAQGQPSTPRDPWTGMDLPLLPGETYVPLPHGCGLIRQKGERQNDYTNLRWIGPCRYGLIHGAGIWDYFNSTTGQWSGVSKPLTLDLRGYYHLGRALPASSKGVVSLPLHPRRSESVYISIQPELRPYTNAERAAFYSPNSADVFDAGGKQSLRVLASKSDVTAAYEINEDVWIVKQYCSTDFDIPDLRTNVYKYRLAKNPIEYFILSSGISDEEKRRIAAKLETFCSQALMRRTGGTGRGAFGGAHEIFKDVDYGHWFSVVTRQTTTPRAAEGVTPEATTKTQIALCPDPNSIASCEPLWRAALEPYKTRHAELRLVADGEGAMLRKQLDDLHAPIATAWRAKAKQVAEQ